MAEEATVTQWSFGHKKAETPKQDSNPAESAAPAEEVDAAKARSSMSAPSVAEMLANIGAASGNVENAESIGSNVQDVFVDSLHDISLHDMLKQAISMKASDIFIAAARRPCVKIDGDVTPMAMFPLLNEGECERLLRSILKDHQLRELDENWELDCAYELDGFRFRVNMHRQMHGLAAVFRLLGEEILPPEKIGLTDAIMKLCNLDQGLVIVTGPTGSGKTTTLATMIDKINREKAYHILTIEDPVEIVHPEKYKCVITQRELGSHTKSFANALRAALREAPDIILVGEMRDPETIELALTAAETGHLVFGTLHTRSASETVNRIIDVFDSGKQPMVRSQLSGSLKAVVSQKLLKRVPKGRVAAREVMICNAAIANLIRTSKVHEIYSSIQSGTQQGMKTLEQHLAELAVEGAITLDTALECANDSEVFKSYFENLQGRKGI